MISSCSATFTTRQQFSFRCSARLCVNNPVGTCCTTITGTAKFVGKEDRITRSVCGPPVEAPMATR